MDRRLLRLGVPVVLAVGLAAGAAVWVRAGKDGLPEYDPIAVVACSDFRDLVLQVHDNRLSPEAFRARVARVYDLARQSDPRVAPGVADAASLLHRTATSGTADETVAAIDDVKRACSQRAAKLR